MILLTLCGNTLVLVAIATNKSLQRPCNFFLASLAIADLGVSIYFIRGLNLYYDVEGCFPAA
jgi:hypothetical protein